MSTDTTATTGTSRRDAVVEQLFLGAIGALETLHVYIGDRLGLYAALAGTPDATPNELANTTGIAERYALYKHMAEPFDHGGGTDVALPATPISTKP